MLKLLFLLALIATCFADVDIDVDFDFDVNDQEVKIKSKFENDTHEDKLEYRIYGQDHPHFEAKLMTEVNDVETEFTFEIEFKKLFEYIPSDPSVDLSYKEFKDTIVNELEDFDIQLIEDLTPNSNTSKKFRMAGKNNFFAAIISLKIADPVAIKFNPKDIKVDIQINNTELKAMGWLKNSTNLIGLKVKVKTETEIDDERDDEDESSTLPDISDTVHLPLPKSNAGFFTWVNYLECNNGSFRINVLASKLELDTDPTELERSFKVFFSFVPGSGGFNSDYAGRQLCVWDPVLGFETLTTNGVAQIFASLLLVALALFI